MKRLAWLAFRQRDRRVGGNNNGEEVVTIAIMPAGHSPMPHPAVLSCKQPTGQGLCLLVTSPSFETKIGANFITW
eukprot:scaffold187032_cov18-Prasinocladus_malaysianus.AAC.1